MGKFRAMAGMVTATFVVTSIPVTTPAAHAADADIVLSEVMYHAADGTTDDDDDYDYIELFNRGDAAVDLLGWQLFDAVDFVFDESLLIGPGEFVVIVEAADPFVERYPGVAYAGVWDGKLKNSSEDIKLSAPDSTVIDLLTYNDDPPWPGAADGGGRSLERLDFDRPNVGDDSDATNWLASGDDFGTPGAENSVLTSGPVILGVDDGTERPTADEGIPVSAQIFNADAVTITYKVGFDNDIDMPMLDDEASVGGAGDGFYTALLPAQEARTLVRYSVSATNIDGTNTSPAETDTIYYHGVVVADPNEPTNIPVFDYFITEADYGILLGVNRYTDRTSPIVVSYGDIVVDNATVRVRGNQTRSLDKPSLRIELPKGQLISFDDHTAAPVDEFNLFWRNDMKADVGWEVAAEIGLPLVEFFGMRVYRNGDFWGSGAYLSAIDGRWREDNGYDDAAVYKGRRLMASDTSPEDTANRFEKKAGTEGDFTDIWELSNLVIARKSDQQLSDLMETLDVPAVINYWAYVSFLNQTNSDRKNFYLIRDPEVIGRWSVIPWDLNLPTGGGSLWTNDMPLIDQLNEYEVFREMHARRLRSIIDSYTAEELIQRFDDKFVDAVQTFDEDRAIWRQGYASAKFRSTWVDRVPVRYDYFAAHTDTRRRSLPVSQTGLRPIEISAVTPAGGNLPAIVTVTNVSSTESFDLSGWTLDAIEHTVAPGTVLLPGATVDFTTDDPAYRQATDGAFAAGEFSELPDEGVLALSDATGQVVSVFPYGGPDVDGDNVDNDVDNCPVAPNPDQEDGDGDGIGDACDENPEDGPSGDVDGDLVANDVDNCPDTPNPDQEDDDGDGVGNVCQPDISHTPQATVGPVSVEETNTGTKQPARFTVELDRPAAERTVIGYSTSDGTATAGSDYNAKLDRTVVIQPGQTSQTVTIYVRGDDISEPNETFDVNFTVDPNVVTLLTPSAQGTIVDDDILPTISVDPVSVTEPDAGTSRAARFTLTLDRPARQNIVVTYSTSDGTATAGSDYNEKINRTATIFAGRSNRTITIYVTGDNTSEPDETFNLHLTIDPAAAVLATPTAAATIIDNDE